MVINLSDIKVPIAKPIIGEEEINNVVDVLKSGMIAQGPKVEEFEKKFAQWVGVKHGIAVNSGTATSKGACPRSTKGIPLAIPRSMAGRRFSPMKGTPPSP